MKHLKTCIAVSLDGFIATKDNELDWIPENVKKEISVAYEQPDVLLAGVNTFAVGGANSEKPNTVEPQHSCRYDIDEDCLTVSTALYSCYTIEYLNGQV